MFENTWAVSIPSLQLPIQDRKPLRDDVRIPQSLEDQAMAQMGRLFNAEEVACEEHMAEMIKASCMHVIHACGLHQVWTHETPTLDVLFKFIREFSRNFVQLLFAAIWPLTFLGNATLDRNKSATCCFEILSWFPVPMQVACTIKKTTKLSSSQSI